MLTAGTLLGLTVALAACGSSGPSSGRPGTTSSPATTASLTSPARASSKAAASAKAKAPASTSSSVRPSPKALSARIQLARCFRSHGINLPDPTSTGQLTAAGVRALQNLPRTEIRSVFKDCHAYAAQAFAPPKLTPAQGAQLHQQLVKFAQCIRSHGLKIGNPTSNDRRLAEAFPGVDPSSPAFQSAYSACRSLIPNFGG